MEIVNLLKNQPRIFGSYSQFIGDCNGNTLPNTALSSHVTTIIRGRRRPDSCFRPAPRSPRARGRTIHRQHLQRHPQKTRAWETTALLVVYDEHGGIYDHVVPPACESDGKSAPADKTGTGAAFNFDRLGVRVPAILVSPYIPRGTVVPGTEDPNGRIFEHACIPGTVTNFFLKNYDSARPARRIPTIFSRP